MMVRRMTVVLLRLQLEILVYPFPQMDRHPRVSPKQVDNVDL